MKQKTEPSSLKINTYWVLTGLLVTSLISISSISESWQRISPEIKQQISIYAYSMSVSFSYLVWVFVVIGINKLINRIPMFSQRYIHWSLIHGLISVALGVLLLFIDAALIWWTFSYKFSFFSAYYEKLLRWLPYEILAYWAALGILSSIVISKNSKQTQNKHYIERMPITENEETVVVPVNEITQIQAFDNYVVVFSEKQQHILNETMKSLESALDPKTFLRVHRSNIINLNKIKSIIKDNNGDIVANLANGNQVSVSRRKRAKLNLQLKEL